MIHMMCKDYKLIYKYWIGILLFSVAVVGCISVEPVISDAIYYFLVNLIVYLLIFNGEAKSSRGNTDMIILSLPITKDKYVLSKYINIIMYFFVSTIGLIVLSSGLNLVIDRDIYFTIKLPTIMFTLASVLLLYAFYLPILFRYGYNNIRLLSTVLYMCIILVPIAGPRLVKEHLSLEEATHLYGAFSNNAMIPVMMFFLIASLIYLFSIKLSVKVFRDL